jgi:hypothetical protein
MARKPTLAPLNKTTSSRRLPADTNITKDSFVMNPDGSVVIKDKALAKILTDSVPAAVNKADVAAVKVGVSVDF